MLHPKRALVFPAPVHFLAELRSLHSVVVKPQAEDLLNQAEDLPDQVVASLAKVVDSPSLAAASSQLALAQGFLRLPGPSELFNAAV